VLIPFPLSYAHLASSPHRARHRGSSLVAACGGAVATAAAAAAAAAVVVAAASAVTTTTTARTATRLRPSPGNLCRAGITEAYKSPSQVQSARDGQHGGMPSLSPAASALIMQHSCSASGVRCTAACPDSNVATDACEWPGGVRVSGLTPARPYWQTSAQEQDDLIVSLDALSHAPV